MLRIKYTSFEAKFTSRAHKWKSPNSDFQKFLNESLPDDLFDADVPFRKGPGDTAGMDGVALESIMFLDDDLKVVEYDPDPVPDDRSQ